MALTRRRKSLSPQRSLLVEATGYQTHIQEHQSYRGGVLVPDQTIDEHAQDLAERTNDLR